MNHRQVAAAVIAVLLVSSSVGAVESSIFSTESELSAGTFSGPVSVSGTGDDAVIDLTTVKSTHTTDTDFNGADTLSNVTVEGSGDEASVTLGTYTEPGTGTFTLDDFNDGDVSEYGGDTGSASLVTSPVEEGTHALKLDGDGVTISSTSGLATAPYVEAGDTIRSYVRVENNDEARPRIYFATQDETNQPEAYMVELNDANNELKFQYVDGAGGSSNTNTVSMELSPDVYYFVEIQWATDGTIDMTVYNPDGSVKQSLTVTDTTLTSGGIGWHVNYAGSSGGGAYFDNATAYGDTDVPIANDNGTYIGPTHSVENVVSGETDLSLSNATATVSWQTDTDGDGTWTNVSTTEYLTSGVNSVDLSSSDATDWRVRVDFNKTGTEPTAKLHDESVSKAASGTYTSADHPVENASSFYLAATLSNATLNATVEGYDSDTGTWENAGTVNRSTTTFDTYNVTTGYSKYRSKITLTRVGAGYTANVHAEGVSAGGTTVIEETTTTTTTTDQQTLIDALRPTQANQSLVAELLSAQVAGQRGKVDRIVHEILVRLGLAQRDVTAAKAATSAEDYYNSRSDEFTLWMNTQSADSNVNLTATDTVRVNFTINGETETRYLIGLVDGDRLATTTVVRSTNRTVDHSVNLTGYAAADATNQLERIYTESVQENRAVTLAQQEAMRERYGPDISTTLWNTTAADSASA